MRDYLVVGAGPTGLALAQCLAAAGRSVLVVDREAEIGGCHRVLRDRQGLFAEHGPRVYSSGFATFRHVLRLAGLDFGAYFAPYPFSFSRLGPYSASVLGPVALLRLAGALLASTVAPVGRDTSMAEWARGLRPEARDYVARLCRMIEGAGPERFTLHEFLQAISQNFGRELYQPSLPTDVGLFRDWRAALEATGLVRFRLGCSVARAAPGRVETLSGRVLRARRVVLAVPPAGLARLGLAPPGWAAATAYDTYLSATFHWRRRLALPARWGGYPATDWGVGFVVASDYTRMGDPRSRTVISAAATMLDARSRATGRTAGECGADEVLAEMLRQLRETLPGLPDPDAALLSPALSRADGRWRDRDSAFLRVPGRGFAPWRLADGLYTAGTHTGFSPYGITSIESAVCNGVEVARRMEPGLPAPYRTVRAFTLVDGLRLALLALLAALLARVLV
jgi:phytoene dehydrogenase-like protein